MSLFFRRQLACALETAETMSCKDSFEKDLSKAGGYFLQYNSEFIFTKGVCIIVFLINLQKKAHAFVIHEIDWSSTTLNVSNVIKTILLKKYDL